MLSRHLLLFLSCSLIIIEVQPTGGPIDLKGSEFDEAEKVLRDTLTKVSENGRPKYTVSQVIKASQNDDKYPLTIYEAKLIDDKDTTKLCMVSIISVDSVAYYISCVGDDIVEGTLYPCTGQFIEYMRSRQ